MLSVKHARKRWGVICVLDGSKALRKGILEHFGDRADIQRCLIHKIRNVEAKLDKEYHFDFKEKIHQAYSMNDYDACKLSMNNLVTWLGKISHNAAESLQDGLEDIFTLHRISESDMPPELRKTFYTTNLIESGFSSPKLRVRRVKRWRKNTDMIKRWAGSH